MAEFECLPEDTLCTILHKVSKESCADLSSVKGSSSNLLKIVKKHENLLYSEASIDSLTKCDRWTDANINFVEKCVEHGNLEAQYWYGLWLFLVRGDWARAKKPLKDASDGGHVMANYIWCLLTILHDEKSDPNLLTGLQKLDTSRMGFEGGMRKTLRQDVCLTPVMYVPLVNRGRAILRRQPKYCDNPAHHRTRSSHICDKCFIDQDARYLRELLWCDTARVVFWD